MTRLFRHWFVTVYVHLVGHLFIVYHHCLLLFWSNFNCNSQTCANGACVEDSFRRALQQLTNNISNRSSWIGRNRQCEPKKAHAESERGNIGNGAHRACASWRMCPRGQDKCQMFRGNCFNWTGFRVFGCRRRSRLEGPGSDI